jgi:hypothetical protein
VRDPLQARAARALGELAAVARAVAEASGAPIPESIAFALDPQTRTSPLQSAQFLEAARVAAESARPDEGIWRRGCVYCFQCRANDCTHAQAPEPADVFAGYAPTGKPTWQNFVEACVERRVDGIDRIFDRGVVAFVETHRLTEELLPNFGKHSATYHVLGQVAVGLVPADLQDHSGPRVPIGLHVVQSRRVGQPVQLRLNLLGLGSEAIINAAADGQPQGPAERLRRHLQATRRRLAGIGRRAVTAEARGEAYAIEPAVHTLLGGLRGDLVRIFDPSARRTQHAEHRRRGGDRPTASVWRDAREAGPERIFVDVHRDTVVVAGPKGRAHVFSRDGKHITSMRLAPGELERRTGRARWRVAGPDIVAQLRAGLGDANK